MPGRAVPASIELEMEIRCAGGVDVGTIGVAAADGALMM